MQYETARLIMYATLLPHAKKGSNLTPQSVLPFEWDNEHQQEVYVPSEEEVLEAKKRWEERDKKKFKKV